MASLYDFLRNLTPQNTNKKEQAKIESYIDQYFKDYGKYLNNLQEGKQATAPTLQSTLGAVIAQDMKENPKFSDEENARMQEYIDSLPEEDIEEYMKEYKESGSKDDFMTYFEDNILPDLQKDYEEDQKYKKELQEYIDDLPEEDRNKYMQQYVDSGSDEDYLDYFEDNILDTIPDDEKPEELQEEDEEGNDEENNEEFFTEQEEAELLKEYEESGSDKDFEDWVKDKQNDDYTKQLQDYINDLPEEDQKKYREEYENSGSKDDFIDYFEKNILPNIPDEEEDLQEEELSDDELLEKHQDLIKEYEESGSDKNFEDWLADQQSEIEDEQDIQDEIEDEEVLEDEQDEVADEQDAVENEEQAVEDVKDVAQDPVEKQELQDEENVLADEDQSLQDEKESLQDQELADLDQEQEDIDEIDDIEGNHAFDVDDYLSGRAQVDLTPYVDQWIDSGSQDDFSTYFTNDIYPTLHADEQVNELESEVAQPQSEIPAEQEQQAAEQVASEQPQQQRFQDTPLADINDLFGRNNKNLLPNISPELRQAYQRMQQGQDTPLEPAENLFRQQNGPGSNQFENQKQQIGSQQNLAGSLAPTLQNVSQAQTAPRAGKNNIRPPVPAVPLTKKQKKQQAKRQAAQQKAQKVGAQKLQQHQRAEAVQSGRPVPYGSQQQATWRKSTSDQPVSIRTTTPEQDVALNSLYKRLPQGIANLNLPGQQSNFAPIANEARRNFSQKTIPSLAERFAGLGDNRLQSSGFAQALGGSAADFESQLAAQQAQYGLQEQAQQSNNLFNSLGSFLRPQFDYTIAPGQNSGIRNAWNAVKQPVLNAGLGYLTGGLSNAAGSVFKGLGNNQQQQMYNNAGLGPNEFQFGQNQMYNPSNYQF